jgi:hypothetical protein
LPAKNLLEWVQISHDIWMTLEKYPDIIIYADIKEMTDKRELNKYCTLIEDDILIKK